MSKSFRYTKTFQKNLNKRFGNQPKIIEQLRTRLKQFQDGIRSEPLNDHALKKKLTGMRAFSVTGDIRIIYEETNTAYVLHDIGTHNQVYK